MASTRDTPLAALIRVLDVGSSTTVELRGLFGISDRALRARVRRANEQLSGLMHIVCNEGRYRLMVDDEPGYTTWKARNIGFWWGGFPTTPRERVFYLINDLLMRSDWVTLGELAATLFCSQRTISSDISRVKQNLSSFDLTLEARPHYGVRVSGSEIKRRVCLANNLLDRMRFDDGALSAACKSCTGFDAETDDQPRFGLSGDFHLDVIAACVDDAITAERFAINSVAYQNLLVHIAIAIMRIRAGSYVPVDTASATAARHSGGWVVATRIAHEIGMRIKTDLPACEIAYIAMHLESKRALYLPISTTSIRAGDRSRIDCALDAAPHLESGPARYARGSASSQDKMITEEVWECAARMIEVIRETFHFDLRGDTELQMNLARHIAPLSVRLKHRMRLENPLLDDIRARYPLAWSFATEASRVLVEAYGTDMSEDEIGYIALAFALALEKQRACLRKQVSFLIVCASGMGSARLLAMRCQEEFGDRLRAIWTCDVSQLDRIDFTDIDYVLTTVPINRSLPIPVHEVGYFLDSGDIDCVRKLLREDRHPRSCGSWFDQALFLDRVTARTRDEAIGAVCAAAARREQLSENFEELVHRREAFGSTAFGNLVALPHPLFASSERTFVCVGLLDAPVDWGGKQVEAIFLIAVSLDSNENLKELYESLLDLISDQAAIARLLAERRFDVLCELLAHARAPTEFTGASRLDGDLHGET